MPTPWWRVLRLREEILETQGNIDDVQMSLYRVAYPAPGERVPYADPLQYGSITEPTAGLTAFMGSVAVRLGGGEHYRRGAALVHLDQGMGGGKSHALIGLYHLATSPDVMAETDIGRVALREAASHLGGTTPDLSGVRVVALCCDNMTPLAPNDDRDQDGPGHTLWERFLWRLVRPDYELYDRFRHRQDQSAITDALRAVGRPVLVLVDEIMDYVRQLDDARYGASRNQDLAFVRALMDAVNDVPHVAAVFVLIASDHDPAHYDPVALRFRDEFGANVTRNGTTMAVSDAADFAAIIRRRIFTAPPAEAEVVASARGFLEARTDAWRAQVFERLAPTAGEWQEQVARCYPFHPDLLALVEGVWGRLAGYQRVRSTFSLFTRAACVWASRGEAGLWAPALIGPGDLPLDDDDTQEHLLSSGVIASDTLAANYRQVITTDIADPAGRSGVAAAMDRARAGEVWHAANPHAAQRMATALLLYSLAARGGVIGATDAEVRAASFVPEPAFGAQDSETVFNGLTDPETGLGSLEVIPGTGGRPRRFNMTTRQTLQMLYRARYSEAAQDQQCDRLAWDQACAQAAGPKGGFEVVLPIGDEPDPATGQPQPAVTLFTAEGEGTERRTRLLVLDPRRWLLLNGRDDETRRDIRALFGVGEAPMATTGAATLAVACANRYRWSNQAVPRARQMLAWQRVAEVPAVAADEASRREAERMVAGAREALTTAVHSAFQHFAYLIRNAADELVVEFGKFEQDGKAAFSGNDVWGALVDGGRAVDNLEAAAFVALLQGWLPRSLASITEDFLSNPRFPMLKATRTLQAAVFDALRTGRMELLGRDGQPLPAPDGAENVALRSSDQTLRWPVPADGGEQRGGSADGGEGRRSMTDAEGSGRGATDGGGRSTEHPRAGGHDGSTGVREHGPAAAQRATLSMRVQGGVDAGTRETLNALFSRIAQAIEMGDIESLDINLQVDGEREQMEALRRAGERLDGTKARIEDLP